MSNTFVINKLARPGGLRDEDKLLSTLIGEESRTSSDKQQGLANSLIINKI